MVGPDYQRPCLDIPETYHYADKEADKEAEEALNFAWWKLFQDPVLEELIAEALANNKDVKIAAANIEDALGVLIQTRAQLFPQIGYNGLYNRLRTSNTLATTELPGPSLIPNPQTFLQGILTGSWDIDVWGRIRRQIESAQANLYATYEARQDVILALATSVANSYIQLLGLDEQLAISIRTLHAYKEEVDYFEKQFTHGQASGMGLAQAQTQYEIAAAAIRKLLPRSHRLKTRCASCSDRILRLFPAESRSATYSFLSSLQACHPSCSISVLTSCRRNKS